MNRCTIIKHMSKSYTAGETPDIDKILKTIKKEFGTKTASNKDKEKYK